MGLAAWPRRVIRGGELLSNGSWDSSPDRGEQIALPGGKREDRGADVRQEPNANTLPFVCECGRSDCLQTLRLSFRDYEQARQQGTFFVCAPGHEITGESVGRVVRRTDSFVIMEKLGPRGIRAEEWDPRADEIENTG